MIGAYNTFDVYALWFSICVSSHDYVEAFA